MKSRMIPATDLRITGYQMLLNELKEEVLNI
jgi:hypothetical protein